MQDEYEEEQKLQKLERQRMEQEWRAKEEERIRQEQEEKEDGEEQLRDQRLQKALTEYQAENMDMKKGMKVNMAAIARIKHVSIPTLREFIDDRGRGWEKLSLWGRDEHA